MHCKSSACKTFKRFKKSHQDEDEEIQANVKNLKPGKKCDGTGFAVEITPFKMPTYFIFPTKPQFEDDIVELDRQKSFE